MTQPKIILLTGPADAGKSTLATYLTQTHSFGRFKFADSIKSIMTVLGLSTREIEGDLKEVPCAKLGGKTPRYAQQTLGTEWGRELMYKNIWADKAVRDVQRLWEWYVEYPVVFDDCRFQNEIDCMREAFEDVTVIKLVPAYEGYRPIKESGHKSEKQELDWDILIKNGWEKQTLFETLDAHLKGEL